MNSVPQNIDAEIMTDDSAAVYTRGIPLYILLPLCALASTFICTGGWRSGLRSTLLGASLLTGVFFLKKLNALKLDWKRRIPSFMLTGALWGLLGASIIYVMELLIGSPTLSDNPYNQDASNLFLICSLYGFFMLGTYALAINFARIKRYFIVLAGAALANYVGIADWTQILTFKELLEPVLFHYLLCVGNCAWFVLLWYRCADGICYDFIRKIRSSDMFILIAAGAALIYFGYMIVGIGSVMIANQRYLRKYQNTVFQKKITGIIVIPDRSEYYDCEKRTFQDLPEKMKFDRNFEYSNSELQPELVPNDFNSYRFCISPDNKFIAYNGGANHTFSSVFCIADLESKQILALKTMAAYMPYVFWVKDMDELERIAEAEKQRKELEQKKLMEERNRERQKEQEKQERRSARNRR